MKGFNAARQQTHLSALAVITLGYTLAYMERTQQKSIQNLGTV